jgi:hypothetical protein
MKMRFETPNDLKETEYEALAIHLIKNTVMKFWDSLGGEFLGQLSDC